jgi:hypothetical protein
LRLPSDRSDAVATDAAQHANSQQLNTNLNDFIESSPGATSQAAERANRVTKYFDDKVMLNWPLFVIPLRTTVYHHIAAATPSLLQSGAKVG